MDNCPEVHMQYFLALDGYNNNNIIIIIMHNIIAGYCHFFFCIMHAEYLKQDPNLPDPRCDDSIIGATGGLTTGLLTAKFGIQNTLFRINSI